MNYLTQHYKNLSEQLQEKVIILQKAINEAGRPTFIPMTVAYDDSGDAEPNIAARTDEEEEDLRVDRVDNFAGDYPNAEYAQMARSLSKHNSLVIDVGAQMFHHRQKALRDHMSQIHRGRPLSTFHDQSQAYKIARQNFDSTYTTPQDLIDQGKGEKVLADISRKILIKHPDHAAFVKMHNERPKVD